MNLVGRWKCAKPPSGTLGDLQSFYSGIFASFGCLSIERFHQNGIEMIVLCGGQGKLREYQLGTTLYEKTGSESILSFLSSCCDDFGEFSISRCGPKPDQQSLERFKLHPDGTASVEIYFCIENETQWSKRIVIEFIRSHENQNLRNDILQHSKEVEEAVLYFDASSSIFSKCYIVFTHILQCETHSFKNNSNAKSIEILWENKKVTELYKEPFDFNVISYQIANKHENTVTDNEHITLYIITVYLDEEHYWHVAHRFNDFLYLRNFLVTQNRMIPGFVELKNRLLLSFRPSKLQRRMQELESLLLYYFHHAHHLNQPSINVLMSFLQIPEHYKELHRNDGRQIVYVHLPVDNSGNSITRSASNSTVSSDIYDNNNNNSYSYTARGGSFQGDADHGSGGGSGSGGVMKHSKSGGGGGSSTSPVQQSTYVRTSFECIAGRSSESSNHAYTSTSTGMSINSASHSSAPVSTGASAAIAPPVSSHVTVKYVDDAAASSSSPHKPSPTDAPQATTKPSSSSAAAASATNTAVGAAGAGAGSSISAASTVELSFITVDDNNNNTSASSSNATSPVPTTPGTVYSSAMGHSLNSILTTPAERKTTTVSGKKTVEISINPDAELLPAAKESGKTPAQRTLQRKSTVETIRILLKLAESHKSNGDYDAAIDAYNQIMLFLQKNGQTLSAEYALCKYCIGCIYLYTTADDKDILHRAEGELHAALDIYRHAYRNVYGEFHIDIADCYQSLCQVYFAQNRMEDAIHCSAEAIRIITGATGARMHENTITCLSTMGVCYEKLNDRDRARECFQEALEMASLWFNQQESPSNEEKKEYFTNAAELYGQIGNLEALAGHMDIAMEYYSVAVEYWQRCFDNLYGEFTQEEHYSIGQCYTALGELQLTAATSATSAASATTALTTATESADNSTSSATTAAANYKSSVDNNNMIRALYAEAVKNFKAGMVWLSIYYEQQPHTEVASCYNNLAAVYQLQLEYEKALACYQQAMNMSIALLGAQHATIATFLINIAGVHEVLTQYPQALKYYHKALTILHATGDNNNSGTTNSANSSTAVGAEKNSTESAEVLEIYRCMGNVYQALGESARALEFYIKAEGGAAGSEEENEGAGAGAAADVVEESERGRE